MAQDDGGNHRRWHGEKRYLTDRMTVTAVIINLYAVGLSLFYLRTCLMHMLMMTEMRDSSRFFMLTIRCRHCPA